MTDRAVNVHVCFIYSIYSPGYLNYLHTDMCIARYLCVRESILVPSEGQNHDGKYIIRQFLSWRLCRIASGNGSLHVEKLELLILETVCLSSPKLVVKAWEMSAKLVLSS